MGMPVIKPGTITREESVATLISSIAAEESALAHILNVATAAYTYTIDPAQPDIVSVTATSNEVSTTVFRNNFGQQVSDLIASVVLEQAALAAIANAEGAKIQRMAAMPGVTPAQLICVNKSVADMMDSIALLEAVLKQKLSIVGCQVDGDVC